MPLLRQALLRHCGLLCCGEVSWRELRSVFKEGELREHLPYSVVTPLALIYPCEDVVGSPSDFSTHPGAGVAWCVRALAGVTFMVSIHGVGRVVSNYLQPYWLVSRADMDVGSFVEEVRRSLPLFPPGLRASLVRPVSSTCEVYVLELSLIHI